MKPAVIELGILVRALVRLDEALAEALKGASYGPQSAEAVTALNAGRRVLVRGVAAAAAVEAEPETDGRGIVEAKP